MSCRFIISSESQKIVRSPGQRANFLGKDRVFFKSCHALHAAHTSRVPALTSVDCITGKHSKNLYPSVICRSSSTAEGEVVAQREVEIRPGVFQGWWTWRGHKVRYQRSGAEGPSMVLVHGFGGNADHWRKNTGPLAAQGYRVFAIDLLGYGYSDKPDPNGSEIYRFNNWGAQLNDFIAQMVGTPSFIIANSVGGLASLEAAIAREDLVKGVQLLDISVRGLHVKRTPGWQRPLVAAFQHLLKTTALGEMFFSLVAQPQTVRNVLRQAYGNEEAVTDELVDVILKPGLLPGAAKVFLDFISYSGGPLPEELAARTQQPVSIVWGEADPWEDVNLGRKYFGDLPCVKEFITLPGVGHCPMDEAPELVNDLIIKFCEKFGQKSSVGV